MSASPALSSDSPVTDNIKKRKARCIREVANFSHVKPIHLIDKKEFHQNYFNMIMPESSPKLVALLKKIKDLDAKDMKTHGKLFKHMIFTDIKSSSYGVKIIASALASNGFHLAFQPNSSSTSNFVIKSDSSLLQTHGNNFAILISKTFYTRLMNSTFRKVMMDLFNRRPDNVHGELLRIIIIDQGFKEGIDLFDVKYVHLFEPLVVEADQKQAIGRSTRFCGQKGLEFHPRYGWPLYVFRYEVLVRETNNPALHDINQLFELYLQYAKIDFRKVTFAVELEKATISAAVDIMLTKSIHKFKIDHPSPILQEGGANNIKKPPKRIMGFDAMQSYIETNFKDFKYPKVKFENLCSTNPDGDSESGRLVKFTPTQEFVRHFFQTKSPYKGMLFFHSVGTGKTCSAIATATSSFDKDGYTIMWVTRHTLKNDLWKNMFDQICNIELRERLEEGTLKLPKKITAPLSHISDNWMKPISYKQFSNFLSEKNAIYKEMVNRNGKKDPLKKTLVIIDEAHKLYSPWVSSTEKADTETLEKMIKNSYKVSKENSVRIIAMTGTPYTEDGMELINLLNLFREPDNMLPSTFEEFQNTYLNSQGAFSEKGLNKYRDDVSGYISYLNRTQDARNFAHPVLEDVYVNMTTQTKKVNLGIKDQLDVNKQNWSSIKILKKVEKVNSLKECKEKVAEETEDTLENFKIEKSEQLNRCKQLPLKQRGECKTRAMEEYKENAANLRVEKATRMEECKTYRNTEMKRLDDVYDGLIRENEELKEKLEEFNQRNHESSEYVKKTSFDVQQLRKESKEVAAKIKEKKTLIKNITSKEEKQVATKALSEDEIAKLNYLKWAIQELVGVMQRKHIDEHINNIKKGDITTENNSQLRALIHRCKLAEPDY